MSEPYYMRPPAELTGPLPEHAVWQSPLLRPRNPEDQQERRARIDRACALWLENFDLATSTILMLHDEARAELHLFQRPLERDAYGYRCVLTDVSSTLRGGQPAPGPYGLVFEELVGDLRRSMPQLFAAPA